MTRGIYTMAPFLVLYALGLGAVGAATLLEARAARIRTRAVEATS